MYDQFDKKLSDRIKYVFDTYEDGTADMGWEQLRQNFPGTKDRRPLLYWLSSSAAVLLLCFGAWLFVSQEKAEQTAAIVDPVDAPVHQEQFDAELKPATPAEADKPRPNKTSIRSTTPAEATASKPLIAFASDEGTLSTENNSSHAIELIPAPAAGTEAAGTPNTNTTETPVSPAQALASERPVTEKKMIEVAADPEEQIRQQAQKLAQLDALVNRDNNGKKTSDKKTGAVSIGLFAGSYFNYSEGSKASMNTGVGISSEIGITSRLKISTGISLAQNTLKYQRENDIPQQALETFMAAPTDNSNKVPLSLDAKTSALAYSINEYDAKLLGLDVPVNIKYMLMNKEKELYVVAGLSSNFFIDESYTYDFQYNTREISDNSTKDEQATSNNSSFDFARMLNFSVGFGYPVGKQSKLSLEPFVKYPLGGLGTQDIRFGSAGLNLKLNFSTR